MKRKRTIATTSGTSLLAPLCLCGAQTALKYLEALRAAMEGVRQAEDSECVHHTRVASRRLRSILPLFATCLSRKACDRWRKQLRRLTRALGEARDTDVQIACVQGFLDQEASAQERPGVERLLLRLQQRRHVLQESVLEALERFAASQITEEIEQILTQLARASQTSSVETPGHYMYRQTGKVMWDQLKALQAYAPYVQQPECSTALHAMRIAAKRLRYTMQAFAPLYLDALEEAVRTARTVQTLLGDIHDCDVWAHDLPQFLAAERERTLVYFGQTEPFTPLIPGLLALQHNRQQYRAQRYQKFVTFWHQVQDQGVWERLQQTLAEAPTQDARRATTALTSCSDSSTTEA
jgi:CHAD domain-containing protein